MTRRFNLGLAALTLGFAACAAIGCAAPAPAPVATPSRQVPVSPATPAPTQISAPPLAAPMSAPPTTAAPSTATPSVAPAVPPSAAPTVAPTAAHAAVLAPDVAAVVNGVTITRAALDERLAELGFTPPTGDDGRAIQASVEAQVLDGMIDQLLLRQAADEAGVAIEPSRIEAQIKRMQGNDRKRFEAWLTANEMTLDDLYEQVRADLVTAALRDQVIGKLSRQQAHVHVRHILLSDEALARQLRQKLEQGENMITLARDYSEDQGTRASGGDLGFLPRGVMDPTFDAAAFALKPGEFSEVLAVPGGYQIVQVVEVDPDRPVTEEHWTLVQQQAFGRWLAELRTKADIIRAQP